MYLAAAGPGPRSQAGSAGAVSGEQSFKSSGLEMALGEQKG